MGALLMMLEIRLTRWTNYREHICLSEGLHVVVDPTGSAHELESTTMIGQTNYTRHDW